MKCIEIWSCICPLPSSCRCRKSISGEKRFQSSGSEIWLIVSKEGRDWYPNSEMKRLLGKVR